METKIEDRIRRDFINSILEDKIRINGMSFSREFANSIASNKKVRFKVEKTKGGEYCVVVEEENKIK